MPLTQERYTLKSSTHSRPSSLSPNNTADRRFEALIKKEMIEHQHVISSHNKDMEALRTSLTLAMEKFKSISERNEKALEEFKEQANQQINHLKERVKGNDVAVTDQRKSIEDINQQVLSVPLFYATKTDLEKVKKDLDTVSKASTVNTINAFQELQREIKILIQAMQNDHIKLTLDMEKRLSCLAEKGERNFSISRIDREAVLKELRIYQHDLFVIEKKIENIYTLIERINKRGEVCHKPA